MKTQVNKEEMRREWIVEKWYEKVFYVTGFAIWVFWGIFFSIGLVAGVFESL